MASVLDWSYWLPIARHDGDACLVAMIQCSATSLLGKLPPGTPARQVAMSILRGSSFQPWDGDLLAGWHRGDAGRGCQSPNPKPRRTPAAAESPDEWCQDVLTKIRDNLLVFQRRRRAGHERRESPWSRLAARSNPSWYGRDESARELWHLEMPFVYAEF